MIGSRSRTTAAGAGRRRSCWLAAIQALDGLVSAQKKQIETLSRQNRELARRLRAVEVQSAGQGLQPCSP
jgi:uncharacterized coiled-coil protein SlyX